MEAPDPVYTGTPTARIDHEEGTVELIVGSCCYDYRVEDLTGQQAIMLGSLLRELGRELIRKPD